MIAKGSKVLVEQTPTGLRASLPAAKWLDGQQTIVTLLDDAPHEGTLDVLDVRRDDGTEESIYDFNILAEVEEVPNPDWRG